MFVLTPLLLVLTTTYAASQMAIIEKVHITTITTVTGQNQTETWCDPKCDITYDYLMGKLGADLPWIYGKLSGKALIGAVCAKDRCSECWFCTVQQRVLEIGGKV